MFVWATLEWAMSPTIQHFKPLNLPNSSYIVSKSNNDWVGWLLLPSPPLKIGILIFSNSLKYSSLLCLITTPSTPNDSKVLTVSYKVSPLATLDALASMLITLIPKLTNAQWNE